MPFGINQCTSDFHGLDEPGGLRDSFEVSVGAAEEGEVVCLVSKYEFWLHEKNQKYEWGREQEEAFQTLKDNLCNTPILSLPDGPEGFVVYCDASNQGLGEASMVENATAEMLRVLDQLMERKEDGCIYFIWVPLIGDVRTLIMDEAHASRLSRSSSGYDTNWVIANRLTNSAYFLAIREDYEMKKLARLYIDEIVARHGVPVSIIPDHDGRFTSRVLENIIESLRDVIGYEYGLLSSDGWKKSPFIWAEIGERRLIRPELVQETTDKGEEIKIDKTLHFVEEPIEIIDREVKSLKRSRILIVKVHWNSKRGHEDFVKTKYLHLLVEEAIIGNAKIGSVCYVSPPERATWHMVLIPQPRPSKDSNPQPSTNDNSLFTKSKNNKFIALLVYIDDIVITGNCVNEIDEFKGVNLFPLLWNLIFVLPYIPTDTDPLLDNITGYQKLLDDELAEKELKQIEADDQAIQTILLGLPKDIYAAVDSYETAQEIWLRVQQMMKGFDIGIQEKKAKLFNEWERFTSDERESVESCYHHFLMLMNDLKQNKHFSKNIASNLKFLNNLQPKWSWHVTIVHQTKDLHTAYYTHLYDFLKYNQKEVDELKAE
nr:reverse transcriptase domain-containing protein [Tanacetum cinerariifolium]